MFEFKIFLPHSGIEKMCTVALTICGVVLLTTEAVAQVPALHDSVPYQGDTLLVDPLPMSVHETDQACLDCDWLTLMSMIRDLEEYGNSPGWGAL